MPFVAGSTSGGLGATHRLQRSVDSTLYNVKLLHNGRPAAVMPLCRPQLLSGWRQSAPAAAAVVRSAALTAASSPLLDEQLTRQPQEPEQQPVPWTPPAGRPGLYDAEGRLVLKCLTLPELEAWCVAEGEEAPANRALQLWRWMYADPPAGEWVRGLEETLGRQNGFSSKFIGKVGSRVSLDGGLRLSQVTRASDGTRKLVFTLAGGEAAGGSVETVLIPVVRQQGLRDRLTICVSSQVGCAMNCQFCYTGRMGLLGNLTTAQIVEQVVEARRFLAREGDRTQLTNLVFMGMGEPLHNTEAVLAAADIISHYMGLHISHNKITVSTVGLVPEMRTVMARSRVQMALSLHATTDEVRDWIVPVNRRYDLATLTAALEELFPKLPAAEPPADPGANPSPPADEGALPGTNPPPPAAASVTLQPASSQHRYQYGKEQQLQRLRDEPAGDQDPASARWLPPLERAAAPGGENSPASGASPGQACCSPQGSGSEDGASFPSSSSSSSSPSSSSSSSLSLSPPSVGSSGITIINTGGSSSVSSSSSSSNVGRSLLIEYTMLHGINDTPEDARRLVDMLARVNCKVNLIVFNPHAGTRFKPSTSEDVMAFRSLLVQRGLVCTIRDSRGDDEMAACGQLGDVGLTFRPSPILEAPERFRDFLLPPPAIPPAAAAAAAAAARANAAAAAAATAAAM